MIPRQVLLQAQAEDAEERIRDKQEQIHDVLDEVVKEQDKAREAGNLANVEELAAEAAQFRAGWDAVAEGLGRMAYGAE